MSAYTRSDLRTEIAQQLRDSGNSIFAAADLNTAIQLAVDELSHELPRQRREVLSLVDERREVSLSPLTDWLEIKKVEYKVDKNPRQYRNFKVWDDTLFLELDSKPSVDDSETITGTVTFTNGSTSITGSGTAFDDEIEADQYIRHSGDSVWYRVKSVDSATTLTIEDAYEGSTDADTEDATVITDSDNVCRVFWASNHTVSDSASTIPGRHNSLMVLGGLAFAALNFANGYLINTCYNAQTNFAAANTTIGSVAARITQAVTDLATYRTDVEADLSTIATAIGNMSARLTQAVTDLGLGDNYINSLNTGGKEVNLNYVNTAKGHIEVARGYLEQAKGYLEMTNASKSYVDVCIAELNSGKAYIEKAQSQIAMGQQQIDIGRVVNSYTKWALSQLADFRNRCIGLSEIDVEQVEATAI